jgi:hypothetical protein
MFKIWYRELPFLCVAIDLDTEMRKAVRGGGYLIVMYGVSGIIEL